MKKIISLTAIIAVLLVALTGCVSINYEVKLNKNGSADISFIYGFEKETLEQLGTTSEEMTADMKEQSQDSGYTIEAYSDDKIEGFKASKHLDNAGDISLQEAFGEDNVKDTEDNKIKVEKKGSKVKFSQKAQIDLTSMGEEYESLVTMKYTINLPFKAQENNANEVSKDGKTLTWELKAGQVNDVQFVASESGSSIALYIIIAVVAVAVVAGVVCVVLKNKKAPEAEAAPTEETPVEETKEEPNKDTEE